METVSAGVTENSETWPDASVMRGRYKKFRAVRGNLELVEAVD